MMTVASGGTRRTLAIAIPPVLFGALVIGAWQLGLFHRMFGLEEYTLAYPVDIVASMWSDPSVLINDIRVTMTEALVGFAIGSALGFAAAAMLFEVPFARRAILPLVSGFAAMPVIALAPLMVLYFGRGIMSKIAVIIIMTAPPMAVATFKGLSSVDRDLENLLVTYSTDRRGFFRWLRFPWSLPFVFTGLKLNVTLSLIGAIIAEFFASDDGLGSRMSYALDTFNMSVAWGTMVLAALIGIIWYQVVAWVERRSVPWHVSIRERAV